MHLHERLLCYQIYLFQAFSPHSTLGVHYPRDAEVSVLVCHVGNALCDGCLLIHAGLSSFVTDVGYLGR